MIARAKSTLPNLDRLFEKEANVPPRFIVPVDVGSSGKTCAQPLSLGLGLAGVVQLVDAQIVSDAHTFKETFSSTANIGI
jgi:hypothetical protein